MPADAQWPNYREADFVVPNYVFRSGESLSELRLHYRTMGTPKRDASGGIVNGVLLLQGNTGTGANWLRPTLGPELFGPGQPLDAADWFIIMPDAIGRGGSSKPSDGLRGKFPHYRYRDMVESGYRLVTEGLGVSHLRLVIGSSMGGMHAWMWAEMYPDLMDGVVPLSCQPVEISGRNWIMRRAAAEAIRHDPDWHNGDYDKSRATTSMARRRTRCAPRARRAFRKWRRPWPPPTRFTRSVWRRRRRAMPTTRCGRSRRSATTAPSPTSTRSRPR
ncbi:MAG TPA: alpha/beta fold hydrolase [Stellaceae bacterium]|nr:alpha/beta fold hydrolase [Stellaceae bacterium]